MTLEAAAREAFAPAQTAVTAGRIPGAILGVLGPTGKTAVGVAGLAQRVPRKQKLTRATWFDLASMTKAIATTTEVLRLVEDGIARLDDPLSLHIPDLHQYVLDAPIRKLTLRQCLSHQTGLPAVEPIYTWGSDPETLKAHILQRDWTFGPNVYSDINFMLLGIVIERRRGRSLAKLPRGPGLAFLPKKKSFAATEACTWRRRMIVGQVHDENAYSLGGFAGHAGLFGTVDGVLGFARDLMSGKALNAESMAEIGTPHSATRNLGWEHRYDGWSGGDRCSAATIGHTGFTGTGLWIDFERGYAWTLLTNRVHPTRHVDTGIQDLRRTVGDRLAAAHPF
ncbi:MAG: class C beta-lactamase-related serine hydrolase [Alphaproteobacteria bacterium]|nr:class C beta-lactamase-related serine hydrolase [Alphaproteobacteria bacterium]